MPAPDVASKDGEAPNRFQFGRNWKAFLSGMDLNSVALARRCLEKAIGETDLSGKTFLDIGSGSGLSSLAARQMGARVVSFDYDGQSVACTLDSKDRFFSHGGQWDIFQGSVLDENFMKGLGSFDIVYSWGVLHHTGDMWRAVKSAAGSVAPGGRLVVALYNDQGVQSLFWKRVKKFYCGSGTGKALVTAFFIPAFYAGFAAVDLKRLRNPLARHGQYVANRGMSLYHDLVDWLGGYPFEVARPGQVKDFLADLGFALVSEQLVGNKLGCNEFVFSRS